MTTKYIAFDIGGVLVDNIEDEIEKTLSGLIGIEPEKFRRIGGRYKNQTSIGNLTLSDYYNTILEELGIYSTTPKELLDAHLEVHKRILASKDERLTSLISILKLKCGIVSLSNIQYEIMEATRNCGLYDIFDKNFLSWEMKKMKPNSDIYIEMLKELHAVPNEVIFIDDLNINIGTARRLGIPSIRYKNYENMKLELEALLS